MVTRPEPPPGGPVETGAERSESMFEHVGGEAAILELSRAMIVRCLESPELSPAFHDRRVGHDERLAAYLIEVLGGPPRYSQDCRGSQSDLVEIHLARHIRREWHAPFIACFVRAMDDVGAPRDERFRSSMAALVQWALDELTTRVDEAPPVAVGLRVPHWDWDGPVG